MHDPRISTALRQLVDLGGDEPSRGRWSWAIVGLERIGRVRLPAPAIEVLGVSAGGEVWARSSRLALIVRTQGPGAAVAVDGRGRMFLPVWLRQAAGPARQLLVGTEAAQGLVVAAVGVLDGIGDPVGGRTPVIDRRLRAAVLLAEAAALGLALEDLIAAHTTPPPPAPTLTEHINLIAPTFSPGTAATYNSYWRLAAEHLGDRRLTDITIVDLHLVVADAARRAQQRRPGSTGRSSQETCVAALRALFNLAYVAGLIATNPAAALTQAPTSPEPPTRPRRPRARRAHRRHPDNQPRS